MVAKRVEQSAVLPYTPAQLYALVNDVEAYPQFLPWCESVAVHERGHDSVEATLTVAKAGIRQHLTTRNALVPDESIEMRLVRGPFRRLTGIWRFEAQGEGATLVRLVMEFEFKNRVVAMALGKLFDEVTGTLVSAFRERAHVCYGGT